VILFAERSSGLMRIPASGGKPVPVTTRKAGEVVHYYPQFLPGGQRFLYLVRHSDLEKQGIYIASLDGKPPPVQILKTGNQARYDPVTRRLLYVENESLMARRLELDPPRLVGDATRLTENIAVATGNGYADFSVSGGTLFHGRGVGEVNWQFRWWDRNGKKLETVGQTVKPGLAFRLSPEVGRVAYASSPSELNIWVLDVSRGNSAQLTFQGGHFPVWTPDGRQIYYLCGTGICRKAADGSGEEGVVAAPTDAFWESPTSIAADGQTLLLGFTDIYQLALPDGAKPQPWLKTRFNEGFSAFSPDGRWVAYRSDESGRAEIYVQGYPDRRGKWLVSQAGGDNPAWRGDSRELYWTAPDGTIMAADIKPGETGMERGKNEALFRVPDLRKPWFQPTSDGKRFLLMEPEGGTERYFQMVVIQNWPAKLENKP
jgi:hypothetical protein